MALQQLGNWLFAPYSEENITTDLHRRIALISGTPEFCHDSISALVNISPADITIRFYDCKTITGAKRKHILGSECDIAVLDCHSRFSPGDVMAVAGSVKRSGCLLVSCPELSTWPDTIQRPFISYGYSPNTSLYLRRFIETLTHSTCTAWFTEASFCIPDLELLHVSKQITHTNLGHFASPDQMKGYYALQNGFKSGQLRAVVSAPRGRGKSSLLGMFIADILTQGKRVLLTSSIHDNVKHVFKFIAQHHSEIKQDTDYIALGKGEVRWVAPDNALLSHQYANQFDLVVIDEAASFPLPILKRVTAVFKQWILSTTLQGYEGSGNGFMLKLIPLFDNKHDERINPQCCAKDEKPNFIHIDMHTPLRWFEDDPIEILLNELCLFQSPYANQTPTRNTDTLNCALDNCHIEQAIQLTQFTELSPKHMQQLMALLSLAHYQTTPDDLMRLMDSPDLRLAVIILNEHVIAAAVINVEGGAMFNKQNMADKIASGERRPKGHLGVQRLALATTDATVALDTYWRVNRIAVTPHLQGRGLGTILLKRISQLAIEDDVSACLTSYGSTKALDKFWQVNNYVVVDKGRKANKASGETSALAMLPLISKAKQIVALLKQYEVFVSGTLPYAPSTELETLLQNKLNQFVQGTRPLDDVWPIINKLATAINNKQAYFAGRPLNFLLSDTDRRNATNVWCNTEFVQALMKPDLNLTTLKCILNANGSKQISQILRSEINALFRRDTPGLG
ncbi:GNAT family N-acetyltransferase [Alteromonas sp. D210916BOD_24]|uniref:GNAT family N-acetyltransferase n=1 Tax=Alteromonas sp. D210916BOD_24 TaxID=3157618 RepID=UPI00399CAF15